MGALDGLGRLAENAEDIPPHDGRELFRTVRRRRTRRRVAGGTVASLAAVLVAVVAWPSTSLWDRMVIDERPGTLTASPDAAPATDPTHALFTTQGGGLIGIDLATGTRLELVAEPEHSAAVIDLAVAAGSTIDDFTAIAFDDGAGPMGFITYVRRDGGEVHTSFTPNDDRLTGHSNRGWRTISPDGRWLAYSGGSEQDRRGFGLVPIDTQTGELVTDDQRFIAGLDTPAEWTGPVSQPGDRSVLVHHPASDGLFTASILERTQDGFAVVETVELDVEPQPDPDGSSMRKLVFGSLRPGHLDDARFDAHVERADVEIDEPVRHDSAVVRYHGPAGAGHVRFELSGHAGNLDLAAQARTALLTHDGPGLGVKSDTSGEAWVIRAHVDDGATTLEHQGPLVRGVVSGALLQAPCCSQPSADLGAPGQQPPLPEQVPDGPREPSSRIVEELLEIDPAVAAAGDTVELRFAERTERGRDYALERQVGDSWQWVFSLTSDLHSFTWWYAGTEAEILVPTTSTTTPPSTCRCRGQPNQARTASARRTATARS